MRIRCNDGKVREFSVAVTDGQHMRDGTRASGHAESQCYGCNELFGISDTKLLKPRWKAHVCPEPTNDTRRT